MGCADSKGKDPYSVVSNKHGTDEIRQFIVAYSKVQFIESSKTQLMAILQQKIESLQYSLINDIESTKIEIDKRYERSLQRIQQSNPKAIPTAQKLFKSRIDQLMGYKDAIKKVIDYKQQCKVVFQREQAQTMSYLQNFFTQFQKEQKQSIPELKKYDSLDEDQQGQFLKTAKQKNKASVQKGLNEVEKVIEDKCNFSNFEPKFQSVVSKQKLLEMINFAERSFAGAQQKVKGASDCKTC